MIDDIRTAQADALSRVDDASSVSDLNLISSDLLGKKGSLAKLKQQLGTLETAEQKKAAGQALNAAISTLEAAIAQRREQFETEALQNQVANERLDLTEFVRSPKRGHAHLVTQAWEDLEDVFIGLGFQVAEGPEIETDWHNFEALNLTEGHPARGELDTLFTDYAGAGYEPGSILLRTHTSPVQIRSMLANQPPIYIVAPGRVFRRDTPDSTHMPVFHQIEGLVVDRDIGLADLAGTIEAFTKAFFGSGFTSRLRPNYFPFTEPSAEFDVQRPDGTWLELGGCGVVHPNVLKAGGIDPEQYSGFAFGFGIDRMAVLRHNIADIREMYVNDMRFISQF